jgi:hypothetical protein
MVEHEAFLKAILQNEKSEVSFHLEEILQGYLAEYWNKHWRGSLT